MAQHRQLSSMYLTPKKRRNVRVIMTNRPTLVSLFLLAVLNLMGTAFALAQTAPSYVITGRVQDELGTVISEVRVCAMPDDYQQIRRIECNVSDANGNFKIAPGRPARYKLFPEKSGAGYYPQIQAFFRHPSTPIEEVALSESNKTASVLISLPPKNGALTGRTIDANTGRPIENVLFLFCQTDHPKNCWATSAKNPTGEFNHPAAYVPFTLKVSAEGYEDWLGLNGFDKDESIVIPSGAKMAVVFYMKRLPTTVNAALSEAEKHSFTNLPAPVQLSPVDRVELDYFPRLTRLEWQAVEGAASYAVEVDYCDGRIKNRRECVNPQTHASGNSPLRGIVETTYEFNFVGAQPGRWRVWAVDKKGQEGFKSPWRTFFYLQ